MTESLGDVFVRLAAETLAGPQERRRFIEAARVILRLDPETKRLPQRQRAKLLSRDISTPGEVDALLDALAGAISTAISRVAEAAQNATSPRDVNLARRIRAVEIFTEHLSPIQNKLRLSEAAHLLRDIWDDAEAAALQDRGRERHRQHPAKENSEDQALADKLRHEATILRSKFPNLTKSARARRLLKRFSRRWPSYKALLMWANRRTRSSLACTASHYIPSDYFNSE